MVNEIKSGIAYFLSTIKPAFPPEEAREKFSRYHALKAENNADAKEELKYLKDELVTHNLGLVVEFAKRYARRNPELLEEFLAFGSQGLVRAVDKFDPSKGNEFSTYAAHWIKRDIRKYLVESRHVIRTPQIAVLEGKVNLKSGDFIGYDTLFSHTASDGASLDTNLQIEDMHTLITQRLTEREAYVLFNRFGISNDTELTLKEIGKELDLTRERVRQIEEKAFAKLRMSDEEWEVYAKEQQEKEAQKQAILERKRQKEEQLTKEIATEEVQELQTLERLVA